MPSSLYNALSHLLDEVIAERNQPTPAPLPVDEATVTGLVRFFDPTFTVFDAIHDRAIYIQPTGSGSIPCHVPNGTMLRAACANARFPFIELQLAPAVVLHIQLTAAFHKPYPDIVTTAKWRCWLRTGGEDSAPFFTDNATSLGNWIVKQVVGYSVPNHVPPLGPTVITSLESPVEEDDVPTRDPLVDDDRRELRSIVLNDTPPQ